ncbi:TetR/AcrR family transcriptional regulator [Holzapfeliella sp. He02]|uniref:TetR/AcrR family transcriptional regulator n=1 Tax=Holzapfeliella saturejae TaxID=3082953 RepID=A0ABU8SFD9_9LACO
MKQDLRSYKTEKAIKSSFFNLLRKESFNNISVINIVRLAEVGRPTFYNHYIDKYDLLNNIIKDYGDIFRTLISQRFKEKDIDKTLYQVADFLIANKKEINLLKTIDAPNIIHEFNVILESEFKKSIPNNLNKLPIDYVKELYISISMVFINHALNTDEINEDVIESLNQIQRDLNFNSDD